MRPLRLLLSLFTSLVAITLVLYIALTPSQDGALKGAPSSSNPPIFNTLFSFTSPGSLFPPSAIISLTDDNSTFFLARPAAFGPSLPDNGLSGPLWTGNGFGDGNAAEGELGCGDAPGQNDDSDDLLDTSVLFKHNERGFEDTMQPIHSPSQPSISCGRSAEPRKRDNWNGGTSDHPPSEMPKTCDLQDRGAIDARLLQKNDNLVGRIALLKRGGCGFLAKVQWAQRRGAAAVIVGDDARGGALIRMYARGDTSNISIPSLFTSYTTARLLSTLVPSGKTLAWPNEKICDFQKHSTVAHRILSWISFDKASRADSNAKCGPSFSNKDSSLTAWRTGTETENRASLTTVHSDATEILPYEPISHQDRWITLTPSNVSTSPFFDTLLVLVVSPLVTLTVVYTLLLFRSRIRRRRWRAPKSVVDRLPVRTYQTLSDSISSATASASSPATPLLQRPLSPSISSSTNPPSQPQSETPFATPLVRQKSRDSQEEKRESALAAWRRRYGGRQKECVVCLEEYEDGVSQVMSLPCGHEFHAGCITPWLVTRRRTCPICKGDVVRSLSQPYQDRLEPTSPQRLPQLSHDEDSVQAQATEIRDNSPSASRPIPSSMLTPAFSDDDVEAVWSRRDAPPNSEDMPENMPSHVSTSLRELSSSVSTIIWRGVEVVKNTTSFRRRPSLDQND